MKNPVRGLVPLLEFNLHRQRPERVDGVAPVCLHLYVWWSPYSTRPQGELAEVVVFERPVRLGGLVQREVRATCTSNGPASIRRLSFSITFGIGDARRSCSDCTPGRAFGSGSTPLG